MKKPLSFKTYEPDETVFREGDLGDCGYIIESGKVEISVERGNGRTVLAVLEKGEIFGEMAIIAGAKRSATARALETATLCVVSKHQLKDRVERADPVVRMLLKVLTARLRIELKSAENKLKEVDEQIVEIITRESGPELLDKDQQDAIDRMRMESQLAGAVENNEFQLYYQPIVDLDTKETVAFEALLRWFHPRLGQVRPDLFIGLSEETDLIIPIGAWVLRKALEDFAILQEAFSGLNYISVNISGKQLWDEHFFKDLDSSLAKFQVRPGSLNLEITESTLIESGKANTWIAECQEMGVSVSLDDFGTGYSSLGSLSQFEIDKLKLDRAFIEHALANQRNLIIPRSVLGMASELDIAVIAEGIETQEQGELLRSLGCHFGQGYYYGRPSPIKQILEEVAKKEKRKRRKKAA